MTNREVLARKSNKELAKLIILHTQYYCDFCIGKHQGAKECQAVWDCDIGIQQWLEQEAKDDIW